MTYPVETSSSAEMLLAKIDRNNRLRIVGAIELLSVDPRPPGVRMLRSSEQGRWRAPVGDYRIVYAIEDDRLIVLVLRVANRLEIYDRRTMAQPPGLIDKGLRRLCGDSGWRRNLSWPFAPRG
jgi:mRNA interferase RelE/StbE